VGDLGHGTVYTFHLRKDVKFHDGTPFNAEVAKWNYDRFANDKRRTTTSRPTPSSAITLDQGSGVVDEFTFRVTLNSPIRMAAEWPVELQPAR
jgi:ABC-type transport system substrate-binding protein